MNNMTYLSSRKIAFASIVTLTLPFSVADGATLTLETKPLFIGTGVTPNVFVMLDDSGSMDFETLIVPHYPACNYTINHHGQNQARDDLIMAGCNAPEATTDQKNKNQTPGCLLLSNVKAPICSSMQYQQAVPSLEDSTKTKPVDINYKTTGFQNKKADGDWSGYTQLDQSYCVFQTIASLGYTKDGQGVWRRNTDGAAYITSTKQLATYDLVAGQTKVFKYLPQTSWSYSRTSNSNATKIYNAVSLGNYIISSCDSPHGFGDFHYISNNKDNVYQTSACTTSDANKNTVGLCPKDTQESDWRLYASAFNVVYYNPTVDYKPWVTTVKKNTDPTRMSAASFSAAKSNPQSGSTGFSITKNLATDYMDKLDGFVYEEWTDDKGFGKITIPANAPATCKDGTRPCRSWANNATTTGNQLVDLWDSHKRFTVTGSSIKMQSIRYTPKQDMTDDLGMEVIEEKTLSGSGPYPELHGKTVEAAIQNIANWYQYSRRRSFVAKTALGEVFNQSPEYRYGLSVINQSDKLFVPVPAASVTDYFPYDNTILSSLYSYKWSGFGTPLRQALGRVGNYFSHEALDKPAKTFDDPIVDVCQQNFALLMTDGYWNEDSKLVNHYGDVDKDGATSGTQLTTLADVARYYWENDLSSLADRVPTSAFDTANWQHLVSFTVAFGLPGALVDTDGDGWPNPALSESGNWGNPISAGEGPVRIDDMWHAAFNSKGAYFSSKNPEELVDGMKEALRIVEARRGSGTSGTSRSPFVNIENSSFNPYFNSGDWSGQLIAKKLNSTARETDLLWDTAATGSEFDLQSYSSRKILFLDKTKTTPDKGADFLWANLSVEQKAFLKETGELDDTQAQARVDYLRGRGVKDTTTWLTDHNFRLRSTKLGDLVNSTPFIFDNVVYVGANDGMLHAFNASTGSEIFAYIPSKVFPRLKELSKPNYGHEYYVDGDPVVRKIGSQTLLIGSLRGGGQGIFALDVTTPSTPKVLWEFNDDSAGVDAPNKELGYTYSRPYIGKLKTGESVVVFGNGYNSNAPDSRVGSGQPVLFMVNALTGDLIKHLPLPSSEPSKPNGLASPAVLLTTDGTGTIQYVYAGDLQGSLWKFNLSVSPAKVSYGSDTLPVPLFVAKAADGTRQPITTKPELMYPPASGYLVLFGTGRYLELEDNSSSDQVTQTLYGVWDRDPESKEKTFLPFTKDDLLQQEIVYRVSSGGLEGVQVVSDNDILYHDDIGTLPDPDNDPRKYLGWYLDLTYNSNNRGERKIVNGEIRSGVLYVNTLIPESTSGCDAGGTGNKYRLCAINGGNGCSQPLFDLNKDNKFDEKDLIDTDGDGIGDLPPSSIPSTVGVPFSPNISDNLLDGRIHERTPGSLGISMYDQVRSEAESFGRQSWQQLLRP